MKDTSDCAFIQHLDENRSLRIGGSDAEATVIEASRSLDELEAFTSAEHARPVVARRVVAGLVLAPLQILAAHVVVLALLLQLSLEAHERSGIAAELPKFLVQPDRSPSGVGFGAPSRSSSRAKRRIFPSLAHLALVEFGPRFGLPEYELSLRGARICWCSPESFTWLAMLGKSEYQTMAEKVTILRPGSLLDSALRNSSPGEPRPVMQRTSVGNVGRSSDAAPRLGNVSVGMLVDRCR